MRDERWEIINHSAMLPNLPYANSAKYDCWPVIQEKKCCKSSVLLSLSHEKTELIVHTSIALNALLATNCTSGSSSSIAILL